MKRITQACFALVSLALLAADAPKKESSPSPDDPADVKAVRAGHLRAELDGQGNIDAIPIEFVWLEQNHSLVPVLSRLRHVKRATIDSKDDRVVQAIVKNWTGLESLGLGNDACDATLADIEGLQNLTTLWVQFPCSVTDEGVKSIAKLRNLEHLTLPRTRITDACMKDIAGLAKLKDLDLSNDQITDSGLKRLKGLKLETLGLRFTRITDRGIDEIKGMTSLRCIDVTYTKVTNSALDKLKLIPELRVLGLPREEIHEIPDDPAAVAAIQAAGIIITTDNITDNVDMVDAPSKRQNPPDWMRFLKGLHSVKDMRLPGDTANADLLCLAGMNSLETLEVGGDFSEDGMKVIGTLTNLRKLHCGGCRGVTSQTAKYLAPLVNLKELELTYDPIGDDGLRYLEGMKKLERLMLNSTKVTNAGLIHLQKLSKLENIDLIGTAVTSEGLKNLRGMKNLMGVRGVVASREDLLRLQKYCPSLHIPAERKQGLKPTPGWTRPASSNPPPVAP